MKLKKILKILLGVMGALLLLLVLTFLFWLGPTVKFVAQTIGPRALGTEVHIDRLSIRPIKGIISLSDFSIRNPDVFGQTNAVSLDSLDISLDMASLFSPTIIVHKVEINSPYFIYEQDLQSDNISEFIANVQTFAGYDPEAPPQPKKEKKAPSHTPPKIVIVEQLAINDVQIHLANTYDEKLDMEIGLDSLTVSMTNGHTRLDNFYVTNPGRLQSPNLFTLDGIDIQMEPGSIYSTNIHFQSVEILNPHAFIEHNPETDTVGEFLKIANSLVAKIPTNALKPVATNTVETAKTDTAPQAPPPEVTIDSIIIDDIQIHSVNIGEPELDVHLGMSYLTVALERGDIRMENLQLSNPAKFTSQDIFSLEEFSIQIAPGSHKEDKLIIEDVQVIQPHVYLELQTNFNTVSEFLRIANGYIERIPTYDIPELPPTPKQASPEASEASATNNPTSAPPVELYNLLVDDIQIKLLDNTVTNNPFPQPTMIAGIKEISARLFEGKINISDILIPCPEGYQTSNIFHLAAIEIDIDPSTLYSDQVVIEEIFIDSPQVDLEQTEESGSVAELQATLLQFAPTPDQLPQLTKKNEIETAHSDEPAKEPIPIDEQPVILQQLEVTNLLVHLTLPAASTNEPAGMLSSLNPLGKRNDEKNQNKDQAEEDSETVEMAVPEVPVSNTPMTLVAFSRLSLEPLKGLLYVDNLKVSNPPNFSPKNLIELEQFRLDIDPDSIQTETFHIEDVLIQKPRIRYERQIRTDNIKALQVEIENATTRRQEFTENTDTVASGETNSTIVVETNSIEVATSETTNAEEQKVIIDRVLITGGLVQAKLSIAPSIPVPLPTIELTEIGKEKGGASLEEAGTQVFDATYDAIIGAVGSTTGFATDTLKGLGTLTFDTLGNAVGSVTDGVSNMTTEATDAVMETVEKVRNRNSKKRRAGGKRSAVH